MCQGAWHSKCYHQYKDDDFPVLAIRNFSDYIVDDNNIMDDNLEQFLEGRDGDQMLILF